MYNIEDFVTRNFDDYRYYGNPISDIQICCIECDDDKYHLHICIDQDKPVIHCFKCGYSSSWIKFVMRVSGLSYWQALGELYVTPKIRGDIKSKISKKYEAIITEHELQMFSLPEDFQLLSKASEKDSHLAKAAKDYMKYRGFSKKLWMKYNIGISEVTGYRIIIPIDRDYWQGRAIYKWLEPKYHNPKEPARDVLFNSGALQLYEEVVVCEGAFSAMAVGDNAIALIGKEPTPEKIQRILASPVQRFIIALEYKAFVTMKKLTDTLIRNGRQVTIWKYQEDIDPADGKPAEQVNYDLKSRLRLLLDD